MLEDVTVEIIFTYLVIFCRVGAALMMAPGMSESYISSKARLVAALGLCLIMYPMTKIYIPPMPSSALEMSLVLVSEIVIGLFMGTVAKFLISILHMAGMIISYNMSLSAANLFDPTQGTQGSVVGVFLTTLGLMLIIASDLHHVFIRGVFDSYVLFSPGQAVPFGGFADTLTNVMSGGFVVAVQIASPHIVTGLLLFLSAGVMGRLMPQMQVFFVLIPVQLLVGVFIIMITLSACMMWFMSYYSEVLSNFLVM